MLSNMLHCWPEKCMYCVCYIRVWKVWWLGYMHVKTSTFSQSVATILSVDGCMCVKEDWATADMWQNDESKVTQAVNHICSLGGHENQGVGAGIMWDSTAFSMLRCIFFTFYVFICIGYIIIWTLLFLQVYFRLPIYKKRRKRERESDM